MDLLTARLGLAGEDAFMGATRKSSSPAHPRDAAHLVIEDGHTIAEVAREISVVEQLLGRRVALERSRMQDRPCALDMNEAGRTGTIADRQRPAAGREQAGSEIVG